MEGENLNKSCSLVQHPAAATTSKTSEAERELQKEANSKNRQNDHFSKISSNAKTSASSELFSNFEIRKTVVGAKERRLLRRQLRREASQEVADEVELGLALTKRSPEESGVVLARAAVASGLFTPHVHYDTEESNSASIIYRAVKPVKPRLPTLFGQRTQRAKSLASVGKASRTRRTASRVRYRPSKVDLETTLEAPKFASEFNGIEQHESGGSKAQEQLTVKRVSVGGKYQGHEKHGRFGQWDESIWKWNNEQLDYESNVGAPYKQHERRLLESAKHCNDPDLCACLFSYRKRIYGEAGVRSWWNAVRQGLVLVPTQGQWANLFWMSFLEVGFKDATILEELCTYAESLYNSSGQRWEHLYGKIVMNFLLHKQDVEEALRFHRRLIENHQPSPREFARLCRLAILEGGNLQVLRSMYNHSACRTAYTCIVPVLCSLERFHEARKWHFHLLRVGDLPPSNKAVDPLLRYLAIYDPPKAVGVTKSLVGAGVTFAAATSAQLKANTKISREMMNIIHGKTFKISVKPYNDILGARWFATTWVSLDVSIQTVHAIGVQEIGPLSLQSIALREPNTKSVIQRIDQLYGLGISIGTSVFSRAIEHFARNLQQDLLEGLLQSDQHPDILEDATLQEQFLKSYARQNEWTQYRRTLEILSLRSKTPEFEKRNLMLRSQLAGLDPASILHNVQDMQNDGIPVSAKTIAAVLQVSLKPRMKGRQPVTRKGQSNRGNLNDLNMSITILKQILQSGSYVAATHWREIIRRLGMLGRFQDLRSLCLDLALWYSPRTTRGARIFRPLQRPSRQFRVPVELPSSHPLHPLKILFDEAFQCAVVEWGFIHALRNRSSASQTTKGASMIHFVSEPTPQITQGIDLLQQLNRYGVHINSPSVRKAIFNRLITYYGPKRSNRAHNRIGKEKMRGRLWQVARELDNALGGKFFTGVDIRMVIGAYARARMEKLRRRRIRGIEADNHDPMLLLEGRSC